MSLTAKEEKEKFKEYKLDEFEEKLRALCEEYDVEIRMGCGCCGGGMYCKDLEFEVSL